ncbi:hypothetical protein V9K67_11570 [Paraflavisolibacter sp. H34]|uniref:hypothetical protein n=1 Tax=Huijunlia imazamoxiresistens TaxID=3127457 RepID=UPI0030191252
MRVYHSYILEGLYVPPRPVALLLGTFPSVLIRQAFGRLRPTDVDFFYGSIDNNFWQDMAALYHRNFLFDRSPEAVRQRMALMDELHLALSDVVLSCETAGSAMDTALESIELHTGLIDLLDRHPSISTLYFTSSSGKVNAETLALRILREGSRLEKMKITRKSGPRLRSFVFTDHQGRQRLMTGITLVSPSPLAEQWGGVTKEKRQALYRQYLPGID